MARYTGPACKLCRREGRKLFLKGARCMSNKCAIDRRGETPPGYHSTRRRKPTEYAIQLREKQKARRIYGVLERQFRKHYKEAARKAGSTGETLIRILEMRLDNVVYRLGLAESRAQARQLVSHGHIAVNDKKTDIPSFIVKVGDAVSVRPSSRDNEYFKLIGKELARKAAPAWLTLDAQQMSGKVVAAPNRAELDTGIEDQLIVEFYSR
jgi:small subunit ribosomal protein S4